MSEGYSNAFRHSPGTVTGLAGRRRDAPGEDGELFRLLFDRCRVCAAALDDDQRVVEANADFVHLVDRSIQRVRGKEFVELLHPGIRSGTRKQLDALLAEKSGQFNEHVVALRSDGSVAAARLTAVAVRGHDQTASILVLLNPNDAHNGTGVVGQQHTRLTDLDARILEDMAAGLSTVQMTSRLNLSRTGVDYHIRALLRKLKVANRPALISRAYTLGLLNATTWPPRVIQDHIE